MASAKKTTTKKATKPEPRYFICVGPLKEEITDPEVLAAAKEYIEAQQRGTPRSRRSSTTAGSRSRP